MDVSRILPNLWVGACPACVEDIDELCAHGVTAVLNLQTDDDLAFHAADWPRMERHFRRSKVALRRSPVRDFDGEDLRRNLPACVEALRELLDAKNVVYLHCTEGIGRAPSVAIAYLHWIKQWELARAAEHVARCRDCSPNLEAIRLARQDR